MFIVEYFFCIIFFVSFVLGGKNEKYWQKRIQRRGCRELNVLSNLPTQDGGILFIGKISSDSCYYEDDSDEEYLWRKYGSDSGRVIKGETIIIRLYDMFGTEKWTKEMEIDVGVRMSELYVSFCSLEDRRHFWLARNREGKNGTEVLLLKMEKDSGELVSQETYFMEGVVLDWFSSGELHFFENDWLLMSMNAYDHYELDDWGNRRCIIFYAKIRKEDLGFVWSRVLKNDIRLEQSDTFSGSILVEPQTWSVILYGEISGTYQKDGKAYCCCFLFFSLLDPVTGDIISGTSQYFSPCASGNPLDVIQSSHFLGRYGVSVQKKKKKSKYFEEDSQFFVYGYVDTSMAFKLSFSTEDGFSNQMEWVKGTRKTSSTQDFYGLHNMDRESFNRGDRRFLDFSDVVPTKDGGLLVYGTQNEYYPIAEEFFFRVYDVDAAKPLFLKFSEDGDLVWVKRRNNENAHFEFLFQPSIGNIRGLGEIFAAGWEDDEDTWIVIKMDFKETKHSCFEDVTQDSLYEMDDFVWKSTDKEDGAMECVNIVNEKIDLLDLDEEVDFSRNANFNELFEEKTKPFKCGKDNTGWFAFGCFGVTLFDFLVFLLIISVIFWMLKRKCRSKAKESDV